MNQFLEVFKTLAEFNEFFTKGMALLGASLAMLAALGTALGQGITGKGAMEALGRQPEAAGKIRTTMIIAQVMTETTAIYCLIIAILLFSKG